MPKYEVDLIRIYTAMIEVDIPEGVSKEDTELAIADKILELKEGQDYDFNCSDTDLQEFEYMLVSE